MLEDPEVANWTVLIVDDEPDNLGVPEGILTFMGAKVFTAANGKEALEVLKKEPITVALVDLSMPEMDGWQMIKEVREKPRKPNQTFIALTAHAMLGDRDRAIEAGYDGYISKPIMLDTFVGQIKDCIKGADRSEVEAKKEPPTPKPGLRKLKDMDTVNWQVLVVEDEPDSIHLMSELITHYGASVTSVTNGAEAIEALTENIPTIIVMDLSMPVKDGWETLKDIRANENTRHIPIVAVTAYHSASVAEDALRAGFDAYFPKPVDPNHFLEQLEKLINN